ncbi:MAG: N-acyl-D-amino-acid deacylase [Candidatus Angelobacter sp.]|jgi:N-acyl-D-amino-acid deacylase|nr:N-acyl-D-amino-acid deacylase [Candidatus Angelobacter sp.]
MKLCLILLFLVASATAFAQAPPPTYDVLIRNGKVIDGSGNPWTSADIGIVGDHIAFIGHAAPAVTAKRTIDAKGLIVAPGFIDMLGQSEQNLLVDKQAVSKLTQGITTEITGEGESISPQNARLVEDAKDWTQHFNVTIDWHSLDEYFRRLEKQGSGINIGTYVGATQLRRFVVGDDDRAPTADELKTMQQMAEDAMQEGAMGVSTSLIYAPAFYAKTDELIALAKIASQYGGIYASHIRNEGDHEAEALDEAFRIAREANIPVEIFHLKASGRENWGKMRDVVARIEQARAQGLDITADQYPYVASATSLGASIPPRFHAGGTEAFMARLKDPAQRDSIRMELSGGDPNKFENMWRGVGGPEGVMVVSVLNPELKQYEGKTIAEIARLQKKDPFDALMDFVLADHNNTGAVYFSMNEQDVRLAMQQPWVSVGTDYGEVNPVGPLGESKSHPRAYGSFPRILGKYVREEKVLTLENAIRKMTSLPAQRVKLEKRGMIRADYYADITIFNPDTVLDVATFENPNRTSTGIEYVLVNGVLSLENGKVTGQLGGRPLRGPGYMGRGAAPDGLRPKGKIVGIVTSPDGWALTRATITLTDATGKVVATANSKREGAYELVSDVACKGCKVTAERLGFGKQEKKIDYNGSNSISFSFVLAPEKRTAKR